MLEKPKRLSSILALAVIATALAGCGKLTPSSAATAIKAADPRTYYVRLHTGQHVIDEAEQKFHAAGLTDLNTQPGAAGAKETGITLTARGQQELKLANARSCGAGCWEIPLGERTNIEVKDLVGGQETTERVVFTWDLRPSAIGRAYGLGTPSFEGTADFKRIHGKWTITKIEDGAPPP